MTSRIPQNSSDRICIHFGFINDDKTAMGYPSMQNYCHQCEPPNTPKYSHQREYCLSANYKECPVFAAAKIGPMPKEIAIEKSREQKSTKKKLIWMLGIIIGIAIFVGFGFAFPKLGQNVSSLFDHVIEPTLTSDPSTASFTPTVVSTITLTPTKAAPTMTFTPMVPRALETPFGLTNQLVVHQVKEGESLTNLAEKYATTVDAIKAVNLIVDTLQANSLLVIPLGQADVSTLPRIKVVKVDDVSITLLDIAKEYNVDSTALSQLNQLSEQTVFKQGDWILIPVTVPLP